MRTAGEKVWRKRLLIAILSSTIAVSAGVQLSATERSYSVLYDSAFPGPSPFRYIAFDQTHKQIFIALTMLSRIDVISSADYHLIHSIPILSPSSLDISPDGKTLAVASSSAHILFFDTVTFVKTNDVVFPDSSLGVTAFLYTANENAMVRAGQGLSTGGGITAYWDHVTNSFINQPGSIGVAGPYQTNGPMTRSGDYSTIMLGDATTGGAVQIIDGNTGQVTQKLSYFGAYITSVAVNYNASRYAICVSPPAFASTLAVLDSSFNFIYQDQGGCIGTMFSSDGRTLYRDGSANGAAGTQSIDMTTFSIRTTTNNFSATTGYATQWQGADGTGMVFGINPNLSSRLIFEAVDTTTALTPAAPAIINPVHIIRVIDNIGSPQGGDFIRILCTGVDNVSVDSVSVTIGGTLATNLTVETLGSQPLYFPTLPNLRLVEVKTPPGTPGVVGVSLRVNGATDTAAKAFQYAQSSKVFPFATNPNFLVYDSLRKKLYASHKDQVEVIDPITQQVLTPLVPASGKLPSSQFAGLSLSSDGNRLYVADTGSKLIHLIDLSAPGTGTSFNPATALSSSGPIAAGRVFETASGKLIGSYGDGGMFAIDRVTGAGTKLRDEFGNEVFGFAWSSTNKGRYIFLSTGSCGNALNANGLISSCMGLWDDAVSRYKSSRDLAQWINEAAANEDGTAIIAGGSTPGILDLFPQVVDFDLNTMGWIENRFDVPMPEGTPSFFLHDSGAVLYKAGPSPVTAGITPFGGAVEIDDLHRFQAVATLAFPEPFLTSYSPYTDHMLATDDTGRYFFGVTNSGISMMVLNTVPFSIGNVRPPFGQAAAGQIVTVRGSGFQVGAVVSFDGIESATTFVDENTLTVTLPVLSVGYHDVSVGNANGDSYTSPGAFQVLPDHAFTPAVITGLSPASILADTDDPSQSVTIVGSGFNAAGRVEINGQPSGAVFIDGSHIQLTVPAALTRHTGSLTVAEVSPYASPSNLFSLPVVNPQPVIHYTLPGVLATGSSTTRLNVFGTGFVSGSTVRWNGQELSTFLIGGATSTGDRGLSATVPAALMASPGTAKITVATPPPGGGISNEVSQSISTAQPVVSYPASVDFGQVLVNTTTAQVLHLENLGPASYTITSATTTPPFSAHADTCVGIPFVNLCNLQVGFTPAMAGIANATLTIADNVTGSPHTIALRGAGTQTLIPSAALTTLDSLGQTVTATLYGNAIVGGAAIPATAWIEYGTDRTLTTYKQSAPHSFTGDSMVSFPLTGLDPSTTYAARLAVQTGGGTGKSPIRLFATIVAPANVSLRAAPDSSSVTTISAGQTATYNLLVSDGGNGYVGTATLSCQGIITGATCSVNPSTAAVGLNPTPFTVTIKTTALTTASLKNAAGSWAVAFGMLIGAGIFAFGTKRNSLGLLIVFVVLGASAAACGGGGVTSSGGTGTTTPPPAVVATPPGAYFVTINATVGAGAQTSQLLTLTVK